jgi:hypothetical protein
MLQKDKVQSTSHASTKNSHFGGQNFEKKMKNVT